MRIIETLGAQGEIRMFRVTGIPENLQKVERENGKLIIGHSETGHHHVLEAERVDLLEDPNPPEGMRILYAILKSAGELKHLRGYDAHDPHHFEPGIYMFRTDREFDHYGELVRRVQD